MPKSVTVSLGGREYQVTELPSRANAAWRKRLQEVIKEITGQVEGLSEKEMTPGSVIAMVDDVAGLVLTAPDRIVDLLLGYAPSIARDWKDIEEQVYDSELSQAFGEVLKLALPFDVMKLIASGRKALQT